LIRRVYTFHQRGMDRFIPKFERVCKDCRFLLPAPEVRLAEEGCRRGERSEPLFFHGGFHFDAVFVYFGMQGRAGDP